MPRYAWPAAFALLLLALVTELIPLLGGCGAEAAFDWGLLYVTLHFVLLPVAAAVHCLWNLAALALGKREFRRRLLAAGSAVVSLSYLALLLFKPVFPLCGPE